MRIAAPNIPRASIDAQISSATYPGHAPARWALPLLDALESLAVRWQLVELDEEDVAQLWLPTHAGEPCHGDRMRLGDGPGGASVRGAADWLAAHAEAYASANPSCWGRITHAGTADVTPIVVAATSVGDRIKPDDAPLVVVDGLHRTLGHWLAGRRQGLAYVPVLRAVSA